MINTNDKTLLKLVKFRPKEVYTCKNLKPDVLFYHHITAQRYDTIKYMIIYKTKRVPYSLKGYSKVTLTSKIAIYIIVGHTVPLQSGHSLDGKGKWLRLEGRWTNSARLSATASAIFSAVAFSPLQKLLITEYWSIC